MSEIIYYIFFIASSIAELSINFSEASDLTFADDSNGNTGLELSLTDEIKVLPVPAPAPAGEVKMLTLPTEEEKRAWDARRRGKVPVKKIKEIPAESSSNKGRKSKYKNGKLTSSAPHYPLERDQPGAKRSVKKVKVKEMNLIDLRISKKTGLPLRPLKSIDPYRNTIFISAAGEKYKIPPMRGLEINNVENIELYHKQLLRQMPPFQAVWAEFKQVTEPALIEKLNARVEYKVSQDHFLLIHYKYYFFAQFPIIAYGIYCLYWYNFMWHNISWKIQYYEKKMWKFAVREISERVYSKEEYELFSAYVKESSTICNTNFRFDSLIPKDGFKPLLTSLENYRDYAVSNNNFYLANRITKHIVYTLKFKKYFDSQIAKLRIKKKNELDTFINKDTSIITHEEIIAFLG